MIKPLDVILTACDRVDLLSITLESFFRVNKYPIRKFHVHNDGTDLLFGDLRAKYPSITWHFSGNRIGLAASLDKLLSFVETEYYMSSEDDWIYQNNPFFIEESLTILKNNPDIQQVWIRSKHDHGHGLGKVRHLNGIPVCDVLKGYQGRWGGFTFNPCVRRLSDYKKFFPKGYVEYGDEILCSDHVESIGYRAVSLHDYSCIHIGNNRHTVNFKL
jgi:hypothetical protein